jgi:LemA protein
MEGWILLALVAVAAAWGVSIYNRLVNLRNQVGNGFSQIDVQLTRRHDLIPNLVEAVKGYLKHERKTLEAVIQARNTATASLRAAAADPTNADAMAALSGAEAALGSALGRLLAVAEAYPDLKASDNMRQFQEELTSTENRVAFARQAYNDAVMTYNNARENFPNVLIANTFGFNEARFLEIESLEKREVPRVAF